MTRISAVVVMLCAFASTLVAADAPDAEVLKLVLREVPRGAVARGLAPALLSNVTRGGAERFAGEWIKGHRGEVIGGEIASAYVEQGRTAEPVAAMANFKLADVSSFEAGMNYDWESLDRKFPGVKSVVVVSRPAFDRLGSIALVRVDMIGRQNAFTQFYDIERRPDGTWKMNLMAMGSRDSMHRPDITRSPGR